MRLQLKAAQHRLQLQATASMSQEIASVEGTVLCYQGHITSGNIYTDLVT